MSAWPGSRIDAAGSGDHVLTGKVIYVPPMAYAAGRAFVAGFRALGIDAKLTPPSNHRTLELGGQHTSGDECYPAKVTVGDFLRALEAEEDPNRVVLFMPTADGPCRFGQYAPYLRALLDATGYAGTMVLAPTSTNAYGGLGRLAGPFARTQWRMLVAADILQKLLLQHRPYEVQAGAADRAFEACLDDLCSAVESSPVSPGPQLDALRAAMIRCRARFEAIETRPDEDRPLIAVVGEIFCRLNTFSNQDVVRRLELAGAEVWIAGLTEWIWYTVSEQFRKLRLARRLVSVGGLQAWLKARVQHRDEHQLLAPFGQAFEGYREPTATEAIAAAQPYLPVDGAFGEMVLNVGRAICLARAGVDGIVDVSPFTCMNGIVSEAVYPRVSRDLGGIPIRNVYFDGTARDLEGELDIYLDMTRSYRRGRSRRRPCPLPLTRSARSSARVD